jgi:hypothetical protein
LKRSEEKVALAKSTFDAVGQSPLKRLHGWLIPFFWN